MPEWLEIIIRSILFLTILFLLTKIIGKKQISELSFFEYVSGITIGSIAGEVIMGLEDSMFYGMIGILTFGITTFAVDYFALKSKKFRDIVEGKSTVLIQDGKILEDNLKKEKYTIDDMSALLRQKDVFNVADVEFAVLEPNGELSVLLKKENQPLTPKDVNLQVAQEKVPQTVIMDGQILDDALSSAGKTRKWLNIELEKLGVLLENVFMAQVDSYGELTVDIFDDKINVPSPQARPLLLAMIKKAQADLELFALETDSEKAKKMYRKNAEKLKITMEKLTPYLSEPLQ
ncbi:hypothetical protein PB1_11484 [Bacillus methanolicus PB1]|uniref:YetF C-terminal domain-containing protein n=1 Tax=Bacillus methanolicus PB1 TaxID=997296 RepID=I3DVA8_BACMT|nr:DUF421 domain-containing protein [Bacillus methanolicus]EIJ78179.1 hypothetical protein PB1_11484 [Bacillus methanolicus PB1]